MARRTRAQRTGEIGEDVVRQIIGNHPNWIVRNQDKDYGIDLEAELAAPVEGEQLLAGKLIKIQVKASESRQSGHRKLAVPLDRGYLNYVAQFRIPVILVAVDVTRKEAWFAWLQQWLLENEIRLAPRSAPAAPTIHIAKDHTLSAGLDGVLQHIARGEDRTAMVLALRELALAATTTNNSIVFDGVLDLLAKVGLPP